MLALTRSYESRSSYGCLHQIWILLCSQRCCTSIVQAVLAGASLNKEAVSVV